ncbi:hypothetical protein A0H81_02637 [Grifola frondosa]|uniref:Uncharacterized protein n=1 Tax=Grifola frondosa TaxID=5627 RepID=A0A1C7MPL8_GRIFR|nr:hypothetical protein A0H81_02637 [Grifola frondosa]
MSDAWYDVSPAFLSSVISFSANFSYILRALQPSAPSVPHSRAHLITLLRHGPPGVKCPYIHSGPSQPPRVRTSSASHRPVLLRPASALLAHLIPLTHALTHATTNILPHRRSIRITPLPSTSPFAATPSLPRFPLSHPRRRPIPRSHPRTKHRGTTIHPHPIPIAHQNPASTHQFQFLVRDHDRPSPIFQIPIGLPSAPHALT